MAENQAGCSAGVLTLPCLISEFRFFKNFFKDTLFYFSVEMSSAFYF